MTDAASSQRLYCDATNVSTPPSVSANLAGMVQYNFRLFRDCNNDGVEDTSTTPCQNTTCPADMDNGSMTGLPDEGVTVDDLVYFLALYTAGYVEADLDDGSGTGTPDNGVTIDDLLYFMTRYEGGC